MKRESKKEDYDLLLLLSTLGSNKIRVLLILAHLYPKAITATQLSLLMGYSLKARTIYRGILNDLEERGLIYMDKLTPKVSSIRINHDNELLNRLIELVQAYGSYYKQELEREIGKKELD
ncbi:MAG: hypothetical protein ACTSQE_01940 [Candidatus Heimdallarchaeaceae archaeon]